MAAKKQKLQSYLREHTQASVSREDAKLALGPCPEESEPTPIIDLIYGLGLCSLIGLFYGLLYEIPRGAPFIESALGICVIGGVIYYFVPATYHTAKTLVLGIGAITVVNAILSIFVPLWVLWLVHIGVVSAIHIQKEKTGNV
jgi:hypothetical protein